MTTAVLQRLLKSTHRAVFETGPDAELVFRLRSDGGLQWSIADDVLEIVTPATPAGRRYGLLDKNIGELVDLLRDDGYEVLTSNATLFHLGARALVPGRGDLYESNGDHVYAHTSILWSIFGGYATELTYAQLQVVQALRQMVMTQAEGEWLDLWAKLYGVPRTDGESDASLQVRIPEEVFRARVNGLAIEKAIKDITGRDVEIREPWKLMFRLDVSPLSGTHHLHDANFYTSNIIQPVAREVFDMTEVLAIIERNRAAGVLIYDATVELPTRHVICKPPAEYLVSFGMLVVSTHGAWWGGERPLGVMRLDDNEFALNHRAQIFELRTYANLVGAQTDQVFGAPLNIPYAAITLSEGPPLGDENAIFSRGTVRYLFEPEPTLSDELAPSDYEVIEDIRRVERITIALHGAGLEYGTAGVVVVGGSTATFAAAVSVYEGSNTWTGLWGPRNWYGWRNVGMAMTTETA